MISQINHGALKAVGWYIQSDESKNLSNKNSVSSKTMGIACYKIPNYRYGN